MAKPYLKPIAEYSPQAGMPLWELGGFNSAKECVEYAKEHAREITLRLQKYHTMEQN